MSVNGICYTQTYYYNAVTKKFSSRDEDGQAVADYLNTADETTGKRLTDYEKKQKNMIEAFLRMRGGNDNLCDGLQAVEGQKDLYEITYVKENELEASLKVGGQEVCRQMAALCLPGTMSGKWDFTFPEQAPYDEETNSAVIVPGDTFQLKNGYEIVIGKFGAYVAGESYGKGGAEADAYAERMADALTEFIKTANRGCFELTVSAMGDEMTQDLMTLLGQTGIDLSKDFTVNGTKFREEDNKLGIVNAFGKDSKVWNREADWRQESLKRLLYDEFGVTEEALEQGLADYGYPIPERGTGAPYSYLANEEGVIEYNGVVFTLDNQRKWLCLGDMSNMDNVIRIPLSEGGCLMVNRDSIGALGRAISMFSPEDINLILRALKLDAKVQEMKKEIEDMEEGIGKDNQEENADSTEEAQKAAEENGKAYGFNGYGEDDAKSRFQLEEWQLEMLLDQEGGLMGIAAKGAAEQKDTDNAIYALQGNALLSTIHVETGESIGIYYDESSTEDNPVMLVKIKEPDGSVNEIKIEVNKVDPNHASYVEMAALSAHLKKEGKIDEPAGAFAAMVFNSRVKTANGNNIYSKENFMPAMQEFMDHALKNGQRDTYLRYLKEWNIYYDWNENVKQEKIV